MMNEAKNEMMTLSEACTLLDNEARDQDMGLLEYLENFQEYLKRHDYNDVCPETYRAYRIFVAAGREMFAKAL